MKKYLPYIIVLLILSGLTAWYVISKKNSTLVEAEADFKVKDKSRIGKIVLHDDAKRTIVLEKKEDKWLLNEKVEAREDLTNQLLDVVTRIESQAPVSKAAHENVLREMLASNIQVQIFYQGKNTPEKVYYVGGPTLDSKGTYMLMEIDGKPAQRPHVVRIPGLDAYLTPSYEMEEDMWRSRTVFNLTPEAIQSISVQYPEQNYQSFTLVSAGVDSFDLLNYKQEKEPINQGFLYAYASMFQNVQIETYENENEEREVILKSTPYATIDIKSKKGNEFSAKLYLMPINRRSKNKSGDDNSNESDIDRLYISLNNNRDFGVAQIYVWGRLFRTFDDFVKAEKQKKQ